MISFIPDWCHFRYCSLTYNLLSGKNSLFCNRLYILKKASYHGKKIKQKKTTTTTTTKKTLLKFVSVTQAASCCSIQSFDLNDMAIDPYRVWTTKPMKQTEINSAISPFYSIYLPSLFFLFTSEQSYLTFTEVLRVGFEGDNLPLKTDVWLKVLEQPMRNLQAHQRL